MKIHSLASPKTDAFIGLELKHTHWDHFTTSFGLE